MDREKRKYRQLKRDVKRAGSKHRRRDLKQQLRENPEEAATAEENLGRHASAGLNGLDHDATRRHPRDEEEQASHRLAAIRQASASGFIVSRAKR